MRKRIIVIFLAIVSLVAIFVCLVPLAIDVYNSLKAYSVRLAKSSDYTKITTPLSKEIVADLCKNFDIASNDTRCQTDSVVYGPDFFPDIKRYFSKLSQKDATLQTAQEKLGSYLETCNNPNNDGSYRCWYDLRGDGIYSIVIYYTKEDHIYRIEDNVGDS